jgi:peptidoglycan lytic transglycosylase D
MHDSIHNPNRLMLLVWISVFLLVTPVAVKAQTADTFPVYPGIRANVEFWEMIYSRYTTQQGVIHDANDVTIVYEVIDLKPRSHKGSRRLNSNLIKKTKAKYVKILEKIAKKQVLEADEEKRVSSLFGENPDPLILIEAMNSIRFQRGQKDRFINGIIRSGRYMDQIKTIFRNNSLPEDLAYLPHVESSFNYNAYSKFGAAGIWQFTYGTGKRFMQINYTVDERRDPILASYAAVKLLKQNYEKLGGWALAITAYNHGVNSMMRAKKEKGNYETIFSEYNGRRFKFASKNFYSEFLAARKVAKNSDHYFGPLNLEKPIVIESITMPGFIPAKKIAAHLKTDLKSIKFFNPALRKPVFNGQKYIPKGYQLKLMKNPELANLAKTIPVGIIEATQKRSLFYYVHKGDVAGSIARRHGVSLQDLIWANNLNHRATIYVGQNLRIPTPEDSLLLAAKHTKVAAVTQTEEISKPETTIEKLYPKFEITKAGDIKLLADVNLSLITGDLTVKRTFEKDNHRYGIIGVDTGETLGHYAEWLEISTQTIRSINGFRFGKIIDYNDRIVIPLDQVNKPQFEEKRYEYHKEFEEDFLNAFQIDSVIIYEIKRGDNIWTLCLNEFELPFWLIRKYNPKLDFQRLKPYQKIVVPVVEKIDLQD